MICCVELGRTWHSREGTCQPSINFMYMYNECRLAFKHKLLQAYGYFVELLIPEV